MTILDSLQHPWIKVCPATTTYEARIKHFITLTLVKSVNLFFFFFKPKDTLQALSRKESAVNMEKFKKFAARRKWKVLFSFHF